MLGIREASIGTKQLQVEYFSLRFLLVDDHAWSAGGDIIHILKYVPSIILFFSNHNIFNR